jgi:hypothetical protein
LFQIRQQPFPPLSAVEQTPRPLLTILILVHGWLLGTRHEGLITASPSAKGKEQT